MIKKKFKIINAVGIHSGGGLFILNYLKNKIININDILYVDSRLKSVKFNKENKLYKIRNNFFSKIWHEYKILNNKNYTNAEFVFLNGLPPLTIRSGKITVYFQNANILKFKLDLNYLFSLDFVRTLKFFLFKNNVNKWIVFSNNAKKKLSKFVNKKIYIEEIKINIKKKKLRKRYDFIYPASGEDHKNHKKLIQALVILSKKNIYPKVLITLKDTHLKKHKINYYTKRYKLKLFNKPHNNRKFFLNNYNKSKALIFPSFSETLGLPLLEAKKFNIDILASNLDFAKGYTSKQKLFNPFDEVSIADTIIKYLKK